MRDALIAFLALAAATHANAQTVGNGWSFTHAFQADWTGDGTPDLLIRTVNGDMLLYPFVNGTFYNAPNSGKKVGNGWNFTHAFAADWTGDGTPDLLIRTANGDMLLYPFVNGTFYNAPNSGKRVGNGWNFTHAWPGDWNGDGKTDLLIRTSNGDMKLYPWKNGSFY